MKMNITSQNKNEIKIIALRIRVNCQTLEYRFWRIGKTQSEQKIEMNTKVNCQTLALKMIKIKVNCQTLELKIIRTKVNYQTTIRTKLNCQTLEQKIYIQAWDVKVPY